jgi:Rv0078B-related antitoxin
MVYLSDLQSEMTKIILSSIEVLGDEMAIVLRRKTGAERLWIASRMSVGARDMLTNHLRAEHPNWEEHRIHQEAAQRLSHGVI